MKLLSLALVGLVFISYSLFSFLFPIQGDVYFIIGGNHTLQAGQAVDGNLVVLFAQLAVEADALVENRLVAFSSDVDVRGSVGGSILALESDLDLHGQAAATTVCNRIDLLNLVVLLPEIHTPKDL